MTQQIVLMLMKKKQWFQILKFPSTSKEAHISLLGSLNHLSLGECGLRWECTQLLSRLVPTLMLSCQDRLPPLDTLNWKRVGKWIWMNTDGCWTLKILEVFLFRCLVIFLWTDIWEIQLRIYTWVLLYYFTFWNVSENLKVWIKKT